MIKRIKELLEDINKSGNLITFEDRKIIHSNMDKLSPMKITLLINKNKSYYDKINVYDVIDTIEIIKKDRSSKYVVGNIKSDPDHEDEVDDYITVNTSKFDKSRFTEEETEFLRREYPTGNTQELYQFINNKRPLEAKLTFKTFQYMLSISGIKKEKGIRNLPKDKIKIFKDRDEHREYLRRLGLLKQLKRKEKLNTQIRREYKKKHET